MNEVVQTIKKRRSVRRFEPDSVPEKIMRDILDCARLAPTANNIQPWLFGAVTDPDLKSQIAQLSDSGRFIKNCAVCFVVFADSTTKHYLEDACAATENILLACTAYDIGTCWVGAHQKEYSDSAREILDVPEPFVLVALVAAGSSREKPSPQKKTFDQVTFFNRASEMKSGKGESLSIPTPSSPRGVIIRRFRALLASLFHRIGYRIYKG